MSEGKCPRCHRADCLHYRGHRSEAAYIDCLEATSVAERQARQALRDAELKPGWGAVYRWLDGSKDRVVKEIADRNGELERENMLLRDRLEILENENEALRKIDLS